eukprot:NODE_2010_length_1306_cov_32.704835_g1913_i0.p1 GENE.NODE_2010_length_1306_cov_32.704835_g1913_i0~~NODE_2010_length_1306_cov_32.704835_g1913_i0.p1  ORF type:complete len:283 (+),score=74.15 NODE_2010_length_1306_cov_32.704835_g1913_i0:91-849(+)
MSASPQNEAHFKFPATVQELMAARLGPLLLAIGKDQEQISVCAPNTTVAEALRSMAERNTLSLPILDDPVHNKFVGFVDVMSLVRALVMFVQSSNPELAHMAHPERLHQFNLAQLKDILPAVEGNADSCVSPSLVLNATFKDALVPFTMPSQEIGWHVHRLLITKNDGQLAALFTQSDAVQMLARNTKLLGESGKKTILELGLACALCAVLCVMPPHKSKKCHGQNEMAVSAPNPTPRIGLSFNSDPFRPLC